jgi:hypothetical protein
MKMYIFIIAFFSIINSKECVAQIEPYGLQGDTITSISTLPVYYFFCGCEFNICASTEKNGVYLRDISHHNSSWVDLGLQGETIPAASMHHWGTGPVQYQTIFIVRRPDISVGDSTFVYKFNYHFDSTWTPAGYGLTFDSSFSPSTMLSFNYRGHDPILPVVLLYDSRIYRYDYFPNFNEWVLVSSDYEWNVLAISQIFWDGVVWIGGKTDTEELILAKSTNFGDSWLYYSLNEFDTPCTAIAIDPINSDILYLSIEGEIIKTTDGGLNWFRTGLQNSSATFTSIIVDQYNNDHILFGGRTLANNFLLYESYNQGSSWMKIEPALVLPAITGMIADTLDNTFSIFIGTRGNGVFRYKSSLTSLDEESNMMVPSKLLLHQNHPNPFNPTTRISYELPVSGLVTLKVFDILGREITTLVNEEKSAGKYEVEFSSNNLSSGIYFYTLTSREYSRTKKMVLLR